MRWTMEALTSVFEVACMCALACLGLILLPIFCVTQVLKGNPFWFIPSMDKSLQRGRTGRGGYCDHT